MPSSDHQHANAFQALCAEVVPVWSRHLSTAQHQSEAGVGNLLQSFSQLRTLLLAEAAMSNSARLHALLEDILINLQFQDRTSQMLALLQDDMARLAQTAANTADTPPDATTWMARLQSGYAMQEQHTNHATPDSNQAASGGETTYF